MGSSNLVGSCDIWVKLIKNGLGNVFSLNNLWKVFGKFFLLRKEGWFFIKLILDINISEDRWR